MWSWYRHVRERCEGCVKRAPPTMGFFSHVSEDPGSMVDQTVGNPSPGFTGGRDWTTIGSYLRRHGINGFLLDDICIKSEETPEPGAQ